MNPAKNRTFASLTHVNHSLPRLCLKVDFGGTGFVLVRVTSWNVPFVQENKDDPRSHTYQHEPKILRLELDVTFEAKPTP